MLFSGRVSGDGPCWAASLLYVTRLKQNGQNSVTMRLFKPESHIRLLLFFKITSRAAARLCVGRAGEGDAAPVLQVPMEYSHLQDLPVVALRNRLLLLHHVSELFCPCIPMFDLEGALDEAGLGPSVGFDTLRGILISQGKVRGAAIAVGGTGVLNFSPALSPKLEVWGPAPSANVHRAAAVSRARPGCWNSAVADRSLLSWSVCSVCRAPVGSALHLCRGRGARRARPGPAVLRGRAPLAVGGCTRPFLPLGCPEPSVPGF